MRKVIIWLKDGGMHPVSIHIGALTELQRQVYRKQGARWTIDGKIIYTSDVDRIEVLG